MEGYKSSKAFNSSLFSDDLILFGQDNMNTVKAMMEVLNEFCIMSGQTINLEKSKVLVFVSPNVQRNKAKRISDFCGIKLTNNLGKYLGVPLLHIIEKVQNRLVGWVANNLGKYHASPCFCL